MINNSEQWKTEGKCAECRRRNYCHNDCMAKRKRDQHFLDQMVKGVIAGKNKFLERYL